MRRAPSAAESFAGYGEYPGGGGGGGPGGNSVAGHYGNGYDARPVSQQGLPERPFSSQSFAHDAGYGGGGDASHYGGYR
jgi:hypothetical protein